MDDERRERHDRISILEQDIIFFVMIKCPSSESSATTSRSGAIGCQLAMSTTWFVDGQRTRN